LLLTVGGTRPSIEAAIRMLGKTSNGFQLGKIRASATREDLPRGLDIWTTFSAGHGAGAAQREPVSIVEVPLHSA
jgi:hypothetical protein